MRAVPPAGFPAERLLRQRFRLLLGGRRKVYRGQKGADQQDEEINLHVALRCAIAATTQQCKGRSIRSDLQWQWGGKKWLNWGLGVTSTEQWRTKFSSCFVGALAQGLR